MMRSGNRTSTTEGKNADFGQGFYLSPDREFSVRWARERKGYKHDPELL